MPHARLPHRATRITVRTRSGGARIGSRAAVVPLALAGVVALALGGLAAPAAVAAPRRDKERAPDAAAVAAQAAEVKKPSKKTLAEMVEGAETIPGLVTFYRTPEKIWMEVPESLLGAPLGLAAIRVNAGGDFVARGGALATDLVRWSRAGDRLVLTKENLAFRTSEGAAMQGALDASFTDSPVFAGKITPLADEPSPVLVDASSLFGPDLARVVSERSGFDVRPEDAVLVSLKAFPDNVVARVLYRARRAGGPGGGGRPGGGDGGDAGPERFGRPSRLPDPRFAEVLVDYNIYRLKDDGFQPRFADERIGGFDVPYKDYTGIDHRDTLFRHLLLRWDVRKKDPNAAISPAAEPITFTMDPSVPERWRPLVREGAEWWNKAFEKIGIRDAVRVLDPSAGAAWDPADIRTSVIYWNLTDNLVFSGMAGPSVVDPRNGKVLKANVYLNGEFFSFALNRYLVYAWWRAPEPGESATASRLRAEALREMRRDPQLCDRAASFSSQMAFARLVLLSRGILKPGTDEADRYAREAFLELVSHEVGHALGFPHNWKASLGSTWDDVRENRVTGRVASRIFSSSVMDYDPIYLAPKGAPQGDYFMKEVGPYDDLAVAYIYSPLDGMSEAERARALDAIAAKAETKNGMIFDGGELGDIDPTTNSDDLGDDPLGFAESRLKILRDEVLPRLHELVRAEGHDDNLIRQALDSAVFSVALDYVDMTARQVGGQIVLRRVAGSPAAPKDGPPPITPVPADVQQRALDVLDTHVFADGAFAVPPALLAHLKADLLEDWNYPWRYASDYDIGSRIAGIYQAALGTLLDPKRLARVLDNERRVAAGAPRFTLPDLFARLQKSAFGELAGRRLSSDRRSLQRALLADLVRLVLTPEKGTPAEASQLAASSLRSIRRSAEEALKAPGLDAYTEAHLRDVAARAAKALDAETPVPVKTATGGQAAGS